MSRRKKLAVCALAGGLWAMAAQANDSTGFQSTAGIQLSKTDAVTMAREDLFVSPKLIRVSYVFRNDSDRELKSLVVFPFPDLDLSLGLTPPNWAFPQDADNFLDFRLWVNDQPVAATLERKAFFHGKDVTALVEQNNGFVLTPWTMGGYDEAARTLTAAQLKNLTEAGLVAQGEDEHTPQWVLKTAYYWPMAFPPHQDVRVRHDYRPFVGEALLGSIREIDGKKLLGRYVGAPSEVADRYCFDATMKRTLQKAFSPKNPAPYSAAELEYILTTAQNWRGPIGRFHLTLDKGAPKNLISVCWNGLKKTGPTTFEATIADFTPRENLRVLILAPSPPPTP